MKPVSFQLNNLNLLRGLDGEFHLDIGVWFVRNINFVHSQIGFIRTQLYLDSGEV